MYIATFFKNNYIGKYDLHKSCNSTYYYEKSIELNLEIKNELLIAIQASGLYLEYKLCGYSDQFEVTSNEIKRILDNFTLAFIADIPLSADLKTKLTPLELARYLVDQALLKKSQMYKQYGNPPLVTDDAQFAKMFDTTKTEIIDYIKGFRPDFPKNDLQGLFYFTDSHLDEQHQAQTALQIILQCYWHCPTRKQKLKLENGVLDALL